MKIKLEEAFAFLLAQPEIGEGYSNVRVSRGNLGKEETEWAIYGFSRVLQNNFWSDDCNTFEAAWENWKEKEKEKKLECGKSNFVEE